MYETACRSYRAGPNLCADGFPQNSGCMGLVCHTCHVASEVIPPCQNEDLGKPWIDQETGVVIHYQPEP